MTAPALGEVTSLGRRKLFRRLALFAGLLLLVLVVRGSGVLKPSEADPTVPPMPGSAKVVPGLVRAGVPSADEMARLRDTLNVRVIVVLGSASVEERAAAQGLGLQVVVHPLAGEAAPTAQQVNSLVDLVTSMTAGGGKVVYLHGATDTGAAPTMGAMVQLATGSPPSDVLAKLTESERAVLSGQQNQALRDAAAAVTGTAAPGGPYVSLRKQGR